MDELDKLRQKINKIDFELAKGLDLRFSIIKEIAKIKAKNAEPLYQKEREISLLEKTLKKYKNENQKAEYISNILKNIYKESRKLQRKIKN